MSSSSISSGMNSVLSAVKVHQNEKECYYAPKVSDIIIGSSCSTMNHPGNIILKKIIESKIHIYASLPSSSKKEKSKIISNVIDNIKASGANFIQQDSETNAWSVADKRTGHRKVSQAFRFALYHRVPASNAKQKNNRKMASKGTKQARTASITMNNNELKTCVPFFLARDALLLKRKQLENKYMIESHMQSILKLQSQNLDLSTRYSTNTTPNNNAPDVIVIDEESYLSSSSSRSSCDDGNEKRNNPLLESLVKKYEDKIVEERMANFWRSLPED